MSKTVYAAYGIDPDFEGGWNERLRKAFEDEEECREYVESELHGGRYVELELVGESDD